MRSAVPHSPWARASRPPPQDALDEYWAATDPQLGAATGKYFVNRKMRDSPPASYDKKAQQQLWLRLEKQTGIVY